MLNIDDINKKNITEPDFSIIKSTVRMYIILRYIVFISILPLLYFFRHSFPFPYPHFFIVCIFILLSNSLLHCLLHTKKYANTIYKIEPYFDAIMAPLVFYCTGGFLSPFVAAYIVVIISSSIIYSLRTQITRNVYLILAVSYTTVALLQKYNLISSYMDYELKMKSNSIYFYFIILTINLIMYFCYNLLNKIDIHRNRVLNTLQNSYESIIKETSVGEGENMLQSLIRRLAEILNVRGAMIGYISESNNIVIPVAIWHDGDFREFVSFNIKGTAIEKVIEFGFYDCDRQAQKKFPDDFLISQLNAESFSGTIIKNVEGSTIGFLCLFNDILPNDNYYAVTMKIFALRAAIDLEHRQKEEDRKNIAGQIAQSQKMEALGQLAGGVAHDFNNMLSGIMAYCQLIQMELKDNFTCLDYAVKIITLSKRASAIVNKLLTFSRKVKGSVEPVDVHDSISEVINILEHTIEKNIIIEKNLKAGMSKILGDHSELENMFINIAVNARDAMPDGGKIIFETDIRYVDDEHIQASATAVNCKPGDYIVITIIDTGKGMKPETLSHIFEPFFTTKKQGKGTGLGLAAAYSCVENYEGFIEVESKINTGTRFTVYLPLYSKDRPVGQDTVSIIREVKAKGANILLVDDEIDILYSVSKALSKYEYNVKTFPSCFEAIDFFKKHFDSIDLVILDMNMADMDGIQAFQNMKKIDPEVKILFTTAYCVDEDMQKTIYEEGALGLIQKPFRPNKLIEAIENIFTGN